MPPESWRDEDDSLTPEEWEQEYRRYEQGLDGSISANCATSATSYLGWEDPVSLDRATTLPAFPTSALPAWMQELVEEEARFTSTPVDLGAMLGLAVLAACAAGRVRFMVRPGWKEPAILWVVVAMGSGEGKSPVFDVVTAPLWELQDELVEAARPTIVEARTRKEIAEKVAAEAKNQAGKAKAGDRFTHEELAVEAAEAARLVEVPAEPRLLVDDITPEALVTTIADQGGRVALFSSEGGVFGAMVGRYGKPQPTGVSLETWLKTWSADSIASDRVGRDAEQVRAAHLVIGVAAQPDVIRRLGAVPELKDRGLLGRFLFSLPTSMVGYRDLDPPPVSEGTKARYHAAIKALARSLISEDITIEFSEGAKNELVRFRGTIEPRMAPGGDLAEMKEWSNKLHGEVARLAGLLHVADHLRDGWGRPVEVETVRRAVRIGEYLLPHAQAAHDLVGADERLVRARSLLQWLRTHHNDKTVKRRDVLHGMGRSKFPDAQAAAGALELLADFGWLRPVDASVAGGRGRPVAGPLYELHPSLLVAQVAQFA